jgi:thioredoxin reductase (NADPH)
VAEKVIIIGSGPAGWAAAIYAARANLEPLVYEGALTNENQLAGRPPLGQLSLTTEVENYPGFPAGDLTQFLASSVGENDSLKYQLPPTPDHEKWAVQGTELMLLMKQQAINFGTRTLTQDIVSVDLSGQPLKVTDDAGKELETHTIIVATGAMANYLGLDSEQAYKNRGVSACAVCDGALPRFRDKPLVVVGGGDSAVEEATFLTKYASKVYLIHRRDELRASKIMQQRAFDSEKLDIQWNHEVQEVLGDDDNGVSGVVLSNTVDGTTKQLDATGMFVAIGHTPNSAFLGGQVEINEKGYIKWVKPFRTNTSAEGVFAAGDVADDYYRQAVTSAGTGCMAALDAERYLAEQGIE